MVGFAERGFLRLRADRESRAWAREANAAGRAAASDPAFSKWHDCGGTWFVGIDALPNDPNGGLAGAAGLPAAFRAAIETHAGPMPPLHRGQVSIVYPGYPRPRAGEGEGAFRYRLRRDAAHVDGLIAEGAERRRRIREPHAFILGIGLSAADAEAAPLVVWEGSHALIRAAFRAALANLPRAALGRTDVTECYHAARRRAFDGCARRALPLAPGEGVLLHRMLLHGVAPWAEGATAPAEGRMTAYFRPELAGGVSDWLARP